MNRKMMTKVSNFLLGNGFYIAMGLCITLIVLSGYYLLNSVSTTTNTVAPVTGNVDLIIPDLEKIPVSLPELEEEIEETEEIPEEIPEVEEEVIEEIIPEVVEVEEILIPKEVIFSWPTLGTLSQTHSLEALVFNPIMGDWRTHTGIDISTAEGTAVMSVAEGYVVAVFADHMHGTTVVVSHENGMESTYSNLGEFPSVEVGNWVEGGEIIAVVGKPGLSDSGREPHLQFSMTEDGEFIDPLDVLPNHEIVEEWAETMLTDEYSSESFH